MKQIIDDSQVKVNFHLKENVGLNINLQMPGNYATALFDLENSEKILAVIPNSSRREALIEILSKFRRIRKVYRCNWPLEECPEEVYSFKENVFRWVS